MENKAISKDWIQKPMRISAKQSKFSNEDDYEIFNRFTKEFHCNVEQVNHIFKATDPADLDAFTGEFKEELHGEKIDKYLDNAHKNGIKVICYICAHQLFVKDKNEHPEWLQVDKEGNYAIAYGTDYLGCLNTSWAQYTIDRIAALCKHDVDGVFLDGPLFTPGCCYCDSCNEVFMKKYGKDIHDSSLREFMEFRVDALTDFVKKIRETMDSINPNIILYLNNSAVRPDIIGSNAHRLYPYVDIIASEGGFFTANNASTNYMCTAFAKDIENKAQGKPTVIFTKAERSPSSYVTHTAFETKRTLAQTVANGANTWYGIHGQIDSVNNEGGIATKEFFKFLSDNEEYYTNTQSVAKVALMWSMPTANYYSSSVDASDFTGEVREANGALKADHRTEYMGFVELLSHNHIPFDAIDDVTIEKKINNYEMIILPSCAAMSESNKQTLKEYVKNGGTVLASFEVGVYDEYCENLETSFMEELFGIKYNKVLSLDGRKQYMDIPKNSFPEIESYSQTPDLRIDLNADQAETICRFYLAGKGNYKELAGLGNPAITMNNYGKGKAILYAGSIGEFYITSKDKATRKVFRQITMDCVSNIIETNAPRCVEVILREQEERYILHIINHASDGCRPCDENIPVYDLSFDINVGNTLKSAMALKDEIIDFVPTINGAKISLDKLTDYTVIAIEK